MPAGVTDRLALVLGGTGAVGSEVLRGLARAGVPAVFTYRRARERAEALAAELSCRAVPVELARPAAVREAIRALDAEGLAPTLLVHCAGHSRPAPLAEIDDDEWLLTQAVNCQSAFAACQALAPRMAERGSGDVVLVGALDRTQSLPAPVHFAASQGMLSAMTMALAKELGPRGIRVNMVALGVLDQGLSSQLGAAQRADYQRFSALRRPGTPAEAAAAILWLALENTYMTGRVLAVNGGL